MSWVCLENIPTIWYCRIALSLFSQINNFRFELLTKKSDNAGDRDLNPAFVPLNFYGVNLQSANNMYSWDANEAIRREVGRFLIKWIEYYVKPNNEKDGDKTTQYHKHVTSTKADLISWQKTSIEE